MASELEKGQKFCTQCGIRLVMGITRICYSRETGEPLYHVRGCCPNKRHWWDGHDKGRVESWGPVLMSYEMASNNMKLSPKTRTCLACGGSGRIGKEVDPLHSE